MYRVNEHDLVADVSRAMGAAASVPAEGTLEVVLEGISAMIPPYRRSALRAALPDSAGDALSRRDYDREFGVRQLVDLVAERDRVQPRVAIERIEAVLAALQKRLPLEVFRVLLSELPPEMRAMLPWPRIPSSRPSRVRMITDARSGVRPAVPSPAPVGPTGTAVESEVPVDDGGPAHVEDPPTSAE